MAAGADACKFDSNLNNLFSQIQLYKVYDITYVQ